MSDIKSKYRVDGKQMEEYLKKRFISVSFTFSIIAIIILSMFAFIMYKQGTLEVGLWSFTFSVPLLVGTFLYGVKRWHNLLRQLAETEFILTHDSLVQKTGGQIERDFKFSEIAVIDKKKFGTTIIKGNWLTRFNYYRPKNIPYQLYNPRFIFIPSVTTNYSELTDKIKDEREQAYPDPFRKL